MRTEVTHLYGLPVVSHSEKEPTEFFVMSQGEVVKMEYDGVERPPNLVQSMANYRLKTLAEYVTEKLPSVTIDALHEPGAQLAFKIGGGVKRRYWEKVILPMFEHYAREWNAELRYTVSEFGVSTRWHWVGPFKITEYPDNTSLLSDGEVAKQEELLDKMLIRGF